MKNWNKDLTAAKELSYNRQFTSPQGKWLPEHESYGQLLLHILRPQSDNEHQPAIVLARWLSNDWIKLIGDGQVCQGGGHWYAFDGKNNHALQGLILGWKDPWSDQP